MSQAEKDALAVHDRHIVYPARLFVKKARRWITAAESSSVTEYFKILKAVAIGFVIMGFVGFVVKMFFEPIKNAIAGIPS